MASVGAVVLETDGTISVVALEDAPSRSTLQGVQNVPDAAR
jgi:hypothetical protein